MWTDRSNIYRGNCHDRRKRNEKGTREQQGPNSLLHTSRSSPYRDRRHVTAGKPCGRIWGFIDTKQSPQESSNHKPNANRLNNTHNSCWHWNLLRSCRDYCYGGSWYDRHLRTESAPLFKHYRIPLPGWTCKVLRDRVAVPRCLALQPC